VLAACASCESRDSILGFDILVESNSEERIGERREGEGEGEEEKRPAQPCVFSYEQATSERG